MTVFIAHAPADRAAAEALEKAIERRGQFVELDDGQTALRPVQASDAFVLLASQALSVATARLRLEQRALDAWADGRLVLIKLDNGIPPVGLRDLPAMDAAFEAQRDSKWAEVADAVCDMLANARSQDEEADAPAAPPAAAQHGGGTLSWLCAAAAAVALTAPAFMAINQSAIVVGEGAAPSSNWLTAGAAGAAAGAAVLLLWAITSLARGRKRKSGRSSPLPAGATFVSYARANEASVLSVIAAAKLAGRKFWLDRQGIAAGERWAGEIVRAIRGAAGVVVMCSKDAFESDHVKREVYLADRYKKKLTPVFIEPAEPPEDFEYFFAGVQSLKLFETPEAERAQALARVLGANA